MDGQHDIWKIRNQVKHGTTENGKIARDTIEMLIEERKQYKIETPMTAADITKWTKAKQHKWKIRTEERISKAQQAKERRHRLQAKWVSFGFTFEQRTTGEMSHRNVTERNTATTQGTKQDTTKSKKRKEQIPEEKQTKKTKYKHKDTARQHGKLTWHIRKRKRTPTEEGNKDSGENDRRETHDTRTQAEGKKEDRPKRVKPKTKRIRYQQISDSSDSSDMDNDNDNGISYNNTRGQPVEDRKGIG